MKDERGKKFVLFVLIFTMLGGVMTSFAGEWKQDAVGWWYVNDDGSYPVNQWQNINGIYYYFDGNGYMLANAITPDGYQVGADGAWIADAVSYPAACYLNTLASIRKGAVRGYPTDIIDHGNYYEMVNQTLEKLKEYDTKAEAQKDLKKNSEFDSVKKLSNGKYYLSGPSDRYYTEVVYRGSIYISKDATCEYGSEWRDWGIITLSFPDFVARIQEINRAESFGENNSEIYATIESIDEKGYVTHLCKLHPDAMP